MSTTESKPIKQRSKISIAKFLYYFIFIFSIFIWNHPLDMSSVLSAVRSNPVSHQAKYAVLFLHGLGDSGNGWSFMAEHAKELGKYPQYQKLNDVKFVFPNAPIRPVTANRGMEMPAWFDVFTLGLNSGAAREDTVGFLQTISIIEQHIDQLTNEYNIKPENIIVGGFSQGAALSLGASILLKQKVAGFVSLSGFIRIQNKLEERIAEVGSANKLPNFNTKIFHGHGTADQVIRYEVGKNAARFFTEELKWPGYNFSSYSGMGHSTCPQELKEVFDFIVSELPA